MRPPFDPSATYGGYNYRLNLGDPLFRWGKVYALGVFTTSDSRAKRNAEALPGGLGLEFIKRLTPRRFGNRDEENHPRHGGRRYTGLFAQEVESVLLETDIGGGRGKMEKDASGVIQGFAGLGYIPARLESSFTDEEKSQKNKED